MILLIFAMWMINFYILIRGFSFNSYSKIQPNFQWVRIRSILYPYAGDKLEMREALFNLLICLLHKHAGMSKNERDEQEWRRYCVGSRGRKYFQSPLQKFSFSQIAIFSIIRLIFLRVYGLIFLLLKPADSSLLTW